MKGYETFISTIQSQINNPIDIIVSAIHWIFVQEFELKCIGIGDKIDQESNGSELLPTGWNSNSNAYELLYSSPSSQNSETFLLKCIVADDTLIVNLSPFQSTSSQDIHSVIILKSEFIPTDQNNDLNSLIKNFSKDKIDLLNKLIQEKFEKFNPNNNQEKKKPIFSNTEKYPMPPPFSKLIDTQAKSRLIDDNDPLYPRIGGADLDPLGRGLGGGMVFDPFSNNPRIRPQGGPRPYGGKFSGPVPPFARYDPIGPLPDSRFFRPDPDHFQPPRGPGFDPNFL